MDFSSICREFIDREEKGRLPHAFLLFGGANEEKISFVRSFANFLERGEFAEPSGTLSDFFEVLADEEGGDIGIDSARKIKNFLFQSPNCSAKRVAVVNSAHRMTVHAQNAVLKIVEEPPIRGLIFFIADTENTILETLLSRLERIYFGVKAEASEKKEILLELPEGPISDAEAENIFHGLIASFRKSPIENSRKIKILLRRLVAVKEWNTNKKLQLKAVISETGMAVSRKQTSYPVRRNKVK